MDNIKRSRTQMCGGSFNVNVMEKFDAILSVCQNLGHVTSDHDKFATENVFFETFSTAIRA